MRASLLTAFFSGLPLGAYLVFLWSAQIVEDSHQKVANFFFVGYFLSASVFCVIGLESIKSRLDMSPQDFFGDPIGFIKLFWDLMVNDFFRMMLFASGVIVGFGLWKAGAII